MLDCLPDPESVTTGEILEGTIGLATISNPPSNPLSEAVVQALLEAFDRFERAEARVAILRADPRSRVWSAGHDLREITLDGRDPVTWRTSFQRILHRVREFPAPVIAMVHGGVWGAACDLVSTCDLAIGTSAASFAITPSKIGIAYNTGGLTHFLGALPLHIVKEMLFTGEPLAAEDAHRVGFLNHLVAPAELEARTLAIARTIASRAPLAIRVLKMELTALTAAPHLTADEFERIQYARIEANRSADFQEGVRAFFEKRPPLFRGE